MRLCDIKPNISSLKKRKRVGRGNSSGHGTTSGRGSKGQKSRSGAKIRPGFEGGQMPMSRRIPHLRGFKNTRKKEFNIINISKLDKFNDGDVIDFELLASKGLIMKENSPLKILGNGSISKKITVKADYFSTSAIKKIQDAGGTAEVVATIKK
ncbi:MAG: 50S ribosomal protein L15 [Actinobacteria bacterium ADurb.Bin346]|nr:MAG: 50S ribosomal protein L15 [Actinobacteria bacterium ADurb.Bin346]